MENIKLKPDEWQKLSGIVVYDPDGWDRTNFDVDWNREITFDEFYDKSSVSTTMGRPFLDFAELKALVFDKIHKGETH